MDAKIKKNSQDEKHKYSRIKFIQYPNGKIVEQKGNAPVGFNGWVFP